MQGIIPGMSAPILLTKLFVPAVRPELVSRPNLIEKLNLGLNRKLTLISAPAGFGKTTLVTDWLQSQGDDESSPFLVGWLSLDEVDNDPVRFLTYFVSALNRLQGLETEIGVGALQMLQAPQPPSPETILINVINELALATQKIVLILDDYHLIDNQSVHDSLNFLIENLPNQLHLVITTREDPPIQISRLRSRSHLTELRAVDLRFKSSEATEFLNQVMGLNLSAADIAALEARTEGWITGLQMAAISMQGSQNVGGFIESFTGSNRYVLDYLIEEVLEQQPEEIQAFLLQTAILDQLNGSLCDAVTGQENGQETLEMLDRTNLFIIPMDDERQWYRCHHLFGDLLVQRLRQTKLDQEFSLHHQASEWYAQNGFPDQAIEHAFQAEDFDRAVDLIEDQADACWKRGEHSKLRHWLDTLPEKLLFSNPNLCIFHAWEQFAHGQLDAAEETLQIVEKSMTIQDLLSKSDKLGILGRVATIRAFLAFHKGDMDSIYLHSRQALDSLPEDDITWRNNASIPLGDAHSLVGNLEDASRIRLEAWETSKAIGNIYMDLIASMKYAITLRQQGRFDTVIEICQQQILLAEESSLSDTVEAGWILAIWGEVLAEQGNLVDAKKKATQGKKLAQGGDIAILNWCNFCLIRVLYSSGDYAGVEAIIKEIENHGLHRLPPWIMNRITAWQLRLWLAQGKLEKASLWLTERELDSTWEPGNLQELEYISLARFLIAKGQPSDSLDLLERIYKASIDRKHISLAIELLNLQALALHAGGDTNRAMTVLEEALSLSEPGGFLRIFVDEGPPMAKLLYEALSREIAQDYVQKLLAAYPEAEPDKLAESQSEASDAEWIEPLSDRELEVLQLLAEGLSRPEIANKLILSLNTIKTHTRNIYSKLGVNNQMQAVSKARALGFLEKE